MTSKIAWTEKTWNPVVGCTKISSGCKHCYAERMAKRFHDECFSNVRLMKKRLSEPVKWRKPKKIFVCSMADLFHQDVPDDYLIKIFYVMMNTGHTWQILTKRPGRMNYFIKNFIPQSRLVPNNIWLGVTAEDQKSADERIPILLDTPAAVRFVSCEPLLESIEFNDINMIDWVIVGGETGHGARECHEKWVENIYHQCLSKNIPFFFKQNGKKWIEDGQKFKSHLVLDWANIRNMPRETYAGYHFRKERMI